MITSKYSIREQNEATILKTIIIEQTISRAKLALQTGLNKASVSSITKTLIDDNLVIETGMGDGSQVGGRKPIILAFNPKAAVAISIDLGINYIEALLSYLDGSEIVAISRRRIKINAANVVDQLSQTIKELEQSLPKTPHGIVGVTIAIHGIVFENKIVFTPYYDLDQFDLAKELAEVVDYPVVLENEANLTALAEYTFASNFDSLISLSIRSGIGAGIVEDGKLQTGKHGQAGEIGHSILYPDGQPCPCGNHGCLEQYASSEVLYDAIIASKGIDFVDSEVVAAYYRDKDRQVIDLLHENAKHLSIGINNVVSLYDPEIVIINSTVYQKIPALVKLVQKEIKSRFSKDIVIRTSQFGRRAALYGALAVTSQNFLNVQKLKLKLN